MARERPAASDVVPSTEDESFEELAELVIAAGRRGFSRWRVATALGIPATGLAAIEASIGTTEAAAGGRAQAPGRWMS